MPDLWRYARGPDGIDLPWAELRGRWPGPTWLLTAAVHGDEYEGPEAIRRVLASLRSGVFHGAILALPVANPAAYARGSRLTPTDGGNLNRAFPGEPAGAFTPRWAHWLWETFASRADRLIDLHAGGVTWEFEPTAGFYRDEDAPLAAALGLTPWRMPDTPGVFSREFRRLRGPALGVELGSGGVRSEPLTARAAQGVLRAIRGQRPALTPPVFTHHDVLAPEPGEWTASRGVGDEVAEGDVLGTVRNWTGGRVAEVLCSAAGKLLAVRRLVSVERGDMVAVVGVPSTLPG